MHTVPKIQTIWPRRMAFASVLLFAGAAGALEPADARGGEPTQTTLETDGAPWLQPVAGDYPIRRMSSLKSEYRRIREIRRTQIQPEYERRVAEGDDADADAWREATLREVARRDLRDLRARLDR